MSKVNDSRDGLSFGVIIPAYNEASGIHKCVTRVSSVLQKISVPSHLIIVDDGSTDATSSVLSAEAAESGRLLTVVTHPTNLGYGAALKSGVARAYELGYRYVLFMDSDLTNDPSDIPKFVDRMMEDVDIIKASRYVAGGKMQGVPVRRMLVSRLGNRVARLLFRLPIRDYTNGFRAIKTELLHRISLEENGFPIIMEEIFRLSPVVSTYAEVPVTLTCRSAEQRASVFSYRPKALFRYIKYPILETVRRWSGSK